MYVRRKKNRSGSISLQIAYKEHGQVELIETIGVAFNEAEEKSLREKGRQRIQELSRQLEFGFSTPQDKAIEDFLEESNNRPIVQNVGPELILGKIFDDIGLNQIPEDLFRHITLSRLTYPASKLKTSEYLLLHHGIEVDISRIYRFLDRFHLKYKEETEQIICKHTIQILESVQAVFYDITTLYFEAEDEDDLRKIGFSKDGKFRNPQILLGLFVGKNGYPIGYDIFEGNCFEGHTLIPMIKRLEAKYNLPKPVIIADSGLLSKANIETLEVYGYSYIIGARIKSEPQDRQKEILEAAQSLEDGQTVRLQQAGKPDLIIGYSQKRADKDKHNRAKGLGRLQKSIQSGRLTKEHLNNRGYNKFLSIKNTVTITLNEDRIREDTLWDGLKGYVTNTSLSSTEVLHNYNQLWSIEQAFRISKTDLRIRPVYHRLQNRIEAHLCIAFAAYAVYKELERFLDLHKIPLSPLKAIELSKTIYQITFKLPDSKKTISSFNQLNSLQKLLLSSFGVPH